MALLGGVLGCDQGTPALSDSGKGPAPHVVWKYPWAYGSSPGDEGVMAVDVPRVTSIRVQFDRFLEPQSAVRGSICIQSETVGGPGCIGSSPEYDPVDRVAVWKIGELLPGQKYNVTLLVPKDANDPNGIRAFDGVPLAEPYTFSFKTGTSSAPVAPFAEPDRGKINFCSTGAACTAGNACFQGKPVGDTRFAGPQTMFASCASASICHGTPSKGATGVAGAALTLKDRDGGVPGAVTRLVNDGVVATETAVGPAPDKPRRSERDIFGINMPQIDATNPGNSFLLYKLLLGMPARCNHPGEESANPESAPCSTNGGYGEEGFAENQYPCSSIVCAPDAGPATLAPDAGPARMGRVPSLAESWVPEGRWQPPAPGEYDRLRLRIRGDSMGISPGAPVTYQQLLGLSAWIAGGARTDCTAP